MFPYLSDHLQMLSPRVQNHLSRMAEVEKELTTYGVFLRMVRHVVENCLTLHDMNRFRGNDDVHISVFHVIVR